jgi:uncharacterized protein YoxC
MGGFRICLLIAAIVLPLKVVVVSQSLADVARQEEERRKAIKKPSKVYTSDDLRRNSSGGTPTPVSAPGATNESPPRSSSTPSTSTAPSSNAPATSGSTSPSGGSPDGKAAADAPSQEKQEKKDATFWKGRITEARQQLERTQTLAEAMQSRINALNTDFVNTDDPAKRSVVERDRQRALAELERLKKEIKEAAKSISDIEEEARRGNVPPGWLR